ncbi:MAG: SIMPL domain-containing protein [Lachnospiraceae bacterium]|nr:SIMPL domain-containing protein [Lachnospiraceae bacterium]
MLAVRKEYAMREMRVTGVGRLSVKPDRIRLMMNLSDTKKDYEKALEASSEMSSKLQKVFTGCGFQEDDLKTTRFSVDAEYEGYTDKNGNWKQRFKGYRFEQSLKIEFPSDNERLGTVLYALAKSGVKTEFRIQYTVSDLEKCRNELLGKAVADAKEKAAVLAAASGVKLGDIMRIDYSFGNADICSEPVMLRSMAMDCQAKEEGSYGFNMVADDIEADDNVTICFEIM